MKKLSICLIMFLAALSGYGQSGIKKANSKKNVSVRFASYNVEFGHHATAEEIGEMFKQYNLGVVCFNEVPGGDWTSRVGKVLGMKYVYVGKISSANHKDKYKSILSKTPLIDMDEFNVLGEGWLPSSVVKAVTIIKGKSIAIYSLHISGWDDLPQTSQSKYLAEQILPKEKTANIVVMGDFNNHIDNPVMAVYKEQGFSNTWSSLGIDLAKEWTSWNEYTKETYGVIDHILFNKPASTKVVGGGIVELPKLLSDHKPIWAEIKFN
jgi:maltose 6'-phosphate phosphatase